MSTTDTITASIAMAELARRVANKGKATADKAPAVNAIAARMTGDDLRDAVVLLAKPGRKVTPKVATKAAPKGRTTAAKRATALRNQAWAWRNEQFHAGVKVTVDQAYAKFGAVRAK